MRDDRFTVGSIAVLAFICADIGHEVIGHALGFVLAGGHTGTLTTTRLIETQRLGDRGGDIFDLGGPFGNLLFAAIAWLALKILRPTLPMKLFLTLLMGCSLFWAFAYLMFCGVFGHGDWFALIRAVPNQRVWRIVFCAGGFVLYRISLRLVAANLVWLNPPNRAFRVFLVSYLAGGAIATAGAIFDPRGMYGLLHDAVLSGFGSTVGILTIPRYLRKPAEGSAPLLLLLSPIWIVAATALSVFYIFVLGPGIKVTL